MDSGQKKVDFKDDSREEAVAFLDNCCELELAQGAIADTSKMQAKVQALRGSWKYRNAGLSYTAARTVVAMQQQSEEAWARREDEREAAKLRGENFPARAPRAPMRGWWWCPTPPSSGSQRPR